MPSTFSDARVGPKGGTEYRMRTASLHAPLLRGLLLGVAITGCASVEPPGIQPVSLESGTNEVRLSFVGQYSFGFYDIGAAAPAAYDPETSGSSSSPLIGA